MLDQRHRRSTVSIRDVMGIVLGLLLGCSVGIAIINFTSGSWIGTATGAFIGVVFGALLMLALRDHA